MRFNLQKIKKVAQHAAETAAPRGKSVVNPLHADTERMEPATLAMYEEAQIAAEARADAETDLKAVPPVWLKSPFRTGFLVTIGVLAALLLGNMISSLSTVLMYIVGALFIALGLDPVVRWLERRKLKRPLGIAVVYVGLLAIVGIVLSVIIPTVITQTTQFVQAAPGYMQDLMNQDWFKDISNKFSGDLDPKHLVESAQQFISNPKNMEKLAGGLWTVSQGFAGGITATMIILILSLYFLASLGGMKRAFYSMVPLTSRLRVIDITEQVTKSVGRYVSGQVTIALANAICGTIMMVIIGVPFVVILAVLVFCVALIPLVGGLLATALVTLAALLNSPTTALIALIYYLIYMQIEAYVLSPRIMSKAVAVPGPLVVIGTLTGGTLLNLLGALIAIPVTASIILIIKQVWIPRQQNR